MQTIVGYMLPKTAGNNTNMYVEVFQHTLKYLYMKGKINRSVDKCIHLLMKIAKDKAFERLIKLEKGKTSYRIGIINSRHVHSIKLSIQAVTETQCNEWTVTSTSKPENHYTIKTQQKNLSNCHIRCKECNICIHKYTCTCPNSLLTVTMFKHVHLVIKYINSHLNHIPVEPSNVPMKSLNVGNEEIFHEVKVLGEYASTADMKEDVHRDMAYLYTLLDQCTDEDILQQIRKNIRVALNLVEVNITGASSRFNRLSNEPPNNHHKTILLNLKHYKISSTKITKQTNKQKHELKQSLQSKSNHSIH